MTGHHTKRNEQVCSSLKTMLRKIADRHQSYWTVYKTHVMTTPNREAGHMGEDRELNSHIEDAGGIDIGLNNGSDSTHSPDTMLTFRGVEADGCLSNLMPNTQADLNILTREVNNL